MEKRDQSVRIALTIAVAILFLLIVAYAIVKL